MLNQKEDFVKEDIDDLDFSLDGENLNGDFGRRQAVISTAPDWGSTALDKLLGRDDEDEDGDGLPWIDEFDVLKNEILADYSDALHGVDLAIAQRREDCLGNCLPIETVRELQGAINGIKTDGPVLINWYYDHLSRVPHALVLSRINEYQLLSALSETQITFSLAPAFLTAEENLGYMLYHFLERRHAVPLKIY